MNHYKYKKSMFYIATKNGTQLVDGYILGIKPTNKTQPIFIGLYSNHGSGYNITDLASGYMIKYTTGGSRDYAINNLFFDTCEALQEDKRKLINNIYYDRNAFLYKQRQNNFISKKLTTEDQKKAYNTMLYNMKQAVNYITF